MKIGDKVYSKVVGPEAMGIITDIETNKNGFAIITMTLEQPINKFSGYANQYSSCIINKLLL